MTEADFTGKRELTPQHSFPSWFLSLDVAQFENR